MGRLIDADDVISLLVNNHFDDDKENFDLLIHNLCKEVKNIQPVYDVDKVVEQLEKESYQEFCDSERIVNLIDAIEIVKGGGKDEM